MNAATASPQPAAVARLRRLLLGTFVAGAAGTGTELLLLGHVEGWEQWVPLSLIALGLVICLWEAVRPSRLASATLHVMAWVFIASGAAGIYFHYRGNVEFEREMYPQMTGVELFSETMTGATPVLAPGTMVLLGLVGLAYAYARTRLAPGAVPSEVRK